MPSSSNSSDSNDHKNIISSDLNIPSTVHKIGKPHVAFHPVPTPNTVTQDSLPLQLTAGTIAAVASVSFLNPLLVTKVRLQALTKPTSLTVGPGAATRPFCAFTSPLQFLTTTIPNETIFTRLSRGFLGTAAEAKALSPYSIRRIIKTIYREAGWKGFWVGSVAGLAQSVPSTALYMTSYERFRGFLMKQSQYTSQPDLFERISPGIAGGLSRLVAVLVTSPLELVRTLQAGGKNSRVVAGTVQNESISSILSQLVSQGGWRGLYRGLGVTATRDCSFSALYWAGLEMVRPHVRNSITDVWSTAPNAVITFTSAVFASFGAAFLTQPFDTLKTRHQLLGTTVRGTLSKQLRLLVTEQGVCGLFRGLSLRLMTAVPGSALVITVYEGVKLVSTYASDDCLRCA